MSPIPVIALFFVAGIIAGNAFPAPSWSAVFCAAVGSCACLLAIRARRFLILASISSALTIGWSAAPRGDTRRPADPAPCERVLEGEVLAPGLNRPGRIRYRIGIEAISRCLDRPQIEQLYPARGLLFATVLDDRGPSWLSTGARVRLRGQLKGIVQHRNLYDLDSQRGSDAYTMILPEHDHISLLEMPPFGLATFFDEVRRGIVDFWTGAVEQRPASIARALALGESGALSPSDREAFRRTGAAHLLAVSGLHLGLVVALAFGFIRRVVAMIPPIMRRTDPGRVAAALTIPVAIAFAILVGGRPPVVRAAVMAICVLSGRALARQGSPLESLSAAAMILAAADPGSVNSPGFQLSFAAVIGFLLAIPPGEMALETPRTTGRLSSLVAKAKGLASTWLRGSLAATAATAPLVMYHFDRLSWVSVPVNTLAVPIVTVLIMPPLLALTALSFALPTLCSYAAKPFGHILDVFATGLVEIASLPVTIDSPSAATGIGICVLCVGAFAFLRRRPRFAAAALALGAGLLIVFALFQTDRFPREKLTLDFLDVGQGDSTLITFPGGKQWLVDAGGTAAARIGTGHILPVLQRMGVDELETLVLTHPDPDHVEGMADVAAELNPHELWDNTQGKDEGAHESYFDLLRESADRGIRTVIGPALCRKRKVEGVYISVIHPCGDQSPYDPSLSFNDNSIVMKLEFEGVSVLLPGDLSEEGEELLMEKSAPLSADVLKLGHHGSASSTTKDFLRAVAPGVAVASCGRWNRYGMPHGSVLRRLKAIGSKLYRTDLHGGVRITIGEGQITVETAVPLHPGT